MITPTDQELAACPLSAWQGDPGRCRWCDAVLPVPGRWCSDRCADAYHVNHHWSAARAAAMTRDVWSCRHADRGPCAGGLEVDHVEPVWGDRSPVSCAHHLDNLRVLCHRHHLAETRRWRSLRQAFAHHLYVDIATGLPCPQRVIARKPRSRRRSQGRRKAA